MSHIQGNHAVLYTNYKYAPNDAVNAYDYNSVRSSQQNRTVNSILHFTVQQNVCVHRRSQGVRVQIHPQGVHPQG